MAQPQPELTLSGVEGALADNIRAHLALSSQDCNMGSRRFKALSQDFDERIEQALQALGYYRARWAIERSATQDCWQMQLTVEAGEPVRLADIDVTISGAAEQDPLFQDFLADLPIKSGDRLDHGRYEKLKDQLLARTQQHGYFDAVISKKELRVDTRANSADIEIHLVRGPRYVFGELLFEQEHFNEVFLTRYANFKPGDPYDLDKLLAFQRALNSSRYFSRVSVEQQFAAVEQGASANAQANSGTNAEVNEEIDTEIGAQDNAAHGSMFSAPSVPLRVKLISRPKFGYAAGLGFATDTGPRASLEVDNRRVNRNGHRLKAELSVSPVLSNIGAGYEIPLDNPQAEKINLDIGWQTEDTDTSDSDIYNISISRTTVNRYEWVKTLSLAYQYEEFFIDAENQRGTSTLLMPGLAYSRSDSNDFAYPTKGWRLNGSVRTAADGLGSDVSMLQLRAGAKWIRALGNGRILSRVNLGSTLMSDFDELPASLRFFAGGDNSVRGYGYEELGPVNEQGEVIGGKHLLTGSLEYDYPVWRSYALALFYDAGNAFDNDQFKLNRSAGIGVRWRSPLGPIRVDLAVPLDGDESVRLHLSMGPDI